MYKELIAKCIEGNEWAKLQKPCSEREISKAEKIVGYAFPKELKDLLRETNGDNNLLLSAKQIIENVNRNRKILSEAYDDIEKYREKVDRHIFFATDGCGNYFCYRILPDGTADTSAICFWDHETDDCEPVANNIADMIVKYYNGEI